MAAISVQRHSRLLRNRSIFRVFGAYLPRLKASSLTQISNNETNEAPNTMIDSLNYIDFFKVHNLVTIKDLFDAKVHLGHKEGSLDDRMRPFLFGSRLGHLIIDLNQTAEYMRAALNFAAHIAFRGGIILFISKNPQTTHIINKTAKECNEFSYTRQWRSGTFTDTTKLFHTITRLPDLCIFIHTLDNALQLHPAVTHAAKMCIPTIGIVDTNCNPNLITYPVPGNDDTPSAVNLYCDLFKTVILRGKHARKCLLEDVNKES